MEWEPELIVLALADGLAILGYEPIYHMREVKKNGHVENWVKAFEVKFEGKGKPFGREEFDEFLGGWAVRPPLDLMISVKRVD